MKSIVEPLLRVVFVMLLGTTHCKNITLQHCFYRFFLKKSNNYLDANEHNQIAELELIKKSVYRVNMILNNCSVGII